MNLKEEMTLMIIHISTVAVLFWFFKSIYDHITKK